jgi:hypothetical protein
MAVRRKTNDGNLMNQEKTPKQAIQKKLQRKANCKNVKEKYSQTD